MKTLREYIDQLDEISRRDFLKGLGAAAVAGAGIGSANAQDINLVQKQYDWQFADTKGKDTVVDIIKRTVGGKVAITARKQYFLIYNWDDIKSKVPKGFDPGPYGLVLMAVSKDILSGNNASPIVNKQDQTPVEPSAQDDTAAELAINELQQKIKNQNDRVFNKSLDLISAGHETGSKMYIDTISQQRYNIDQFRQFVLQAKSERIRNKKWPDWVVTYSKTKQLPAQWNNIFNESVNQGVAEKDLEEASLDAVNRIKQLVQYK